MSLERRAHCHWGESTRNPFVAGVHHSPYLPSTFCTCPRERHSNRNDNNNTSGSIFRQTNSMAGCVPPQNWSSRALCNGICLGSGKGPVLYYRLCSNVLHTFASTMGLWTGLNWSWTLGSMQRNRFYGRWCQPNRNSCQWLQLLLLMPDGLLLMYGGISAVRSRFVQRALLVAVYYCLHRLSFDPTRVLSRQIPLALPNPEGSRHPHRFCLRAEPFSRSRRCYLHRRSMNPVCNCGKTSG